MINRVFSFHLLSFRFTLFDRYLGRLVPYTTTTFNTDFDREQVRKSSFIFVVGVTFVVVVVIIVLCAFVAVFS